MSVVVGLIHKGKAYVASDGRGVNGGDIASDNIEKAVVTKDGKAIVGAVGDLSEAQRTLIGVANGILRVALTKAHFVWVDEAEPKGGSRTLVISKQRILTMDPMGAIVYHSQFAAVGDGESVANGVLATAFDTGLIGKLGGAKVAKMAVETACRYSAACGGRIRSYEI